MAAISRAQRFALAAEERGWAVERRKTDRDRTVIASRADEAFKITWRDNKVRVGRHKLGKLYEPWISPAEALKVMAEPERRKVAITHNGEMRVIPFDPQTTPDLEILEALAGRKLTWINTLSGNEEVAIVQKGGYGFGMKPSNVDRKPEHRIVEFVGDAGGSFRAVRLSAIIGVE